MNKISKKLAVALVCILFAATTYAYDQYTLLNANRYNQTVSSARLKLTKIMKTLQAKHTLDADAQVAMIVHQLAGIPYIHNNGMGEGDWQATSTVYRPGAVHVNQNPLYRLDELNCQTFVQVTMALLHAKNLPQFDKNIVKIAYGAAGNPNGEIVRYYNRNHFVDADFNPINQRNGLLADVTSQGILSSYAKKTHATITRQKWFLKQQDHLDETVQVLANSSGPAMVNRFQTIYAALPFPRFQSEKIVVSYLPKEILAIRQTDGSFAPNQTVLDRIPTPAVAEIVRDVNRWNYHGMKMKEILGTELTISHLGLLYRQKFNDGDLIYRKITCEYDHLHQKVCSVKPIMCQKDSCNELMYAHATNAYPRGYFWYQTVNTNYVCSSQPPKSGTKYTTCNRVVSVPLYDYLTDYQFGAHWNMEWQSILGVHVEKIM